MLTICKNGHTLRVTRGAYNTIYKFAGYSVVGHNGPSEDKEGIHEEGHWYNTHDTTEEQEEDAEDDFDNGSDNSEEEQEESPETPIGEMEMDELVSYAKSLGIKVKSGMKKKDLRAVIREKISE